MTDTGMLTAPTHFRGSWIELTKRDFDAVFSNVAESVSYRDGGNYNYSVLPRKASRFRVA
jgi:hypothetical protein